jgi:hypothetical protein
MVKALALLGPAFFPATHRPPHARKLRDGAALALAYYFLHRTPLSVMVDTSYTRVLGSDFVCQACIVSFVLDLEWHPLLGAHSPWLSRVERASKVVSSYRAPFRMQDRVFNVFRARYSSMHPIRASNSLERMLMYTLSDYHTQFSPIMLVS